MRPDLQPPPLRHRPESRLDAMRAPLLETLAGAGTRPVRRPRPLMGALAAVAAAVALAWIALPVRTERALAVEVAGEVIELRIVDAEATSERLTQELHDAGVRGYVVAVPAPAHLAGRWVQWGETAGIEPRSACLGPGHRRRATTRLSAIELNGDVLRVPVKLARESSGLFYFIAARRAREGETIAYRGGTPREALPPGVLPRELRELLAPPAPGSRCR